MGLFPQAINDLAVELTAIAGSGADIYRIICDRLFEMTGARLVSLGIYDPENQCLRVKKVSTRGLVLPTANRILGVHLARIPFPVNETLYKKFLSVRAEEFEGTHGLMLGALPRSLCQAMDRALDIGYAYGLAYHYNGELLGTSTIWMPRKSPPLPLANLVAFANFAAAAMQSDRTHTTLASYHDKLRIMAQDLSLAEERERKILAEELHDEVGQLLAMSSIKLGSISLESGTTESNTQEIQAVRDLLKKAIHEVRTLSFELRSPLLTDLGFIPAIQHLGETFTTQRQLQVHVDNDDEEIPLDGVVKGLLFRSVREALLNIVKHAEAQNAWVRISRDDHSIRVSVNDDGVGMGDASVIIKKKSNGFGLISIRDRMFQLGGTFEVHSSPGQGTTLTLTAPIQDGERH
jgi:signal transduction histidine kinase